MPFCRVLPNHSQCRDERMTTRFVQFKSEGHKSACRALYKALLLACTKFPPNDGSCKTLSSTLRALVRFRFDHDRRLQNSEAISDAFAYGRHSLRTVHAASCGHAAALASIRDALATAKQYATGRHRLNEHLATDKWKYPAHVMKKKEYLDRMSDPATFARPPRPITDRPLPLSQIKSGKRVVPKYFATQDIGFLRYNRKQPYRLSLFLRNSIQRMARKWSYVKDFDHEMDLAALEDEWDEIVQSLGVVEGSEYSHMEGPQDEKPWGHALKRVREDIYQSILDDGKKKYASGVKLMEVVRREAKLAEEEKQARKAAKKVAKIQERELSKSTVASSNTLTH